MLEKLLMKFSTPFNKARSQSALLIERATRGSNLSILSSGLEKDFNLFLYSFNGSPL